jgi:ATP-dependent Clp protease protease subunit
VSKQELKALELRKAKAETVKAELEAKAEALRFRSEKRSVRKQLESDGWHRGQFVFNGTIDRMNCQDMASSLERYHRVHPSKPITLTIQSEGGSVLDGWALYDTLRTLSAQGHLVTTRVRGYAASMGAVVFQAGDVRVMGRESHLMLHEVSAGAFGKLHEIKDQAKFIERLNQRIFNVIAERANGSQGEHAHTGEALYRWAKAKDRWLNAETCVERGFADAIG